MGEQGGGTGLSSWVRERSLDELVDYQWMRELKGKKVKNLLLQKVFFFALLWQNKIPDFMVFQNFFFTRSEFKFI